MSPEDETPHPPATAEFGAVTPGGSTHHYASAAGLHVKKFSVGSFDNNVYVIASNGVALIVDGANDADRILAEVADVRVKAIIQTHGHPDHVQALTRLKGELDVPIYAHARDARMLPVNSEDLGEGDTIRIGDATIRVLHTPGTRRDRCASCPSRSSSRATRCFPAARATPTGTRNASRRS